MLHAFSAVDGEEEWAFIPPMVVPNLPLVFNKSYDGAFKKTAKAGGSNAIFGVDGSPVIHDVKIKGLKPDGSGYEISKTWRTLLFIPYGRGGAGFSVLDVTNPKIAKVEIDDDGNCDRYELMECLDLDFDYDFPVDDFLHIFFSKIGCDNFCIEDSEDNQFLWFSSTQLDDEYGELRIDGITLFTNYV